MLKGAKMRLVCFFANETSPPVRRSLVTFSAGGESNAKSRIHNKQSRGASSSVGFAATCLAAARARHGSACPRQPFTTVSPLRYLPWERQKSLQEVSAIEQTPLTNRKRIENFYVLYPFFLASTAFVDTNTIFSYEL